MVPGEVPSEWTHTFTCSGVLCVSGGKEKPKVHIVASISCPYLKLRKRAQPQNGNCNSSPLFHSLYHMYHPIWTPSLGESHLQS